MLARLTCPLGHTWEQAEALPGRVARCPVCGVSVEWPKDEPPTSSIADDAGPTLMHPGDWQPLAPLSGEVPPTLTDFDIISELGRGGMGMVYKARWRPENRIVAVKVIRKDRLQHEEAVRRFRREAQAAARLHHPNIVRVYDSDHTGDTHYLVMEYVDGVTLERLVTERGPLPIAMACDYVRQAALGLQHAHEQALVHRDIKPANLMITRGEGGADGSRDDGPDAVVKILDMGVARVLQLGGPTPGESFSTLTQGGAVIGTADYVAPEQLEDPHRADIRADLYSLGCTFYFLLTGQVPFPGGSLVSKLDKQRWEAPAPVEELRRDAPAAVASAVHKLLAKKPEERFSTPAELAETIEDLARSGFTGADGSRLAIREVRRLLGSTDVSGAVAFSPDGNFAASGGKDRVPRIWNVATGNPVRILPRQTQEIRALTFTPRGDCLAWATGVAVRIGNPATGQETGRLGGHTDAVRGLVFTAEGKRLITAAEDKTVRLWELSTRREVQRMARHTAGATCCGADADGHRALSGSRDQTLRLWDLRNGQELAVITPNAGTVLALAMTADGRFAVSAHFDTLVRLWDLQNGRELRRLLGHKQMVTTLAFTPDARHVVTGSQDQTVRLWQVNTGLELARTSLATAVMALAVAPDGKHLLAAGADHSLRLLALPWG